MNVDLLKKRYTEIQDLWYKRVGVGGEDPKDVLESLSHKYFLSKRCIVVIITGYDLSNKESKSEKYLKLKRNGAIRSDWFRKKEVEGLAPAEILSQLSKKYFLGKPFLAQILKDCARNERLYSQITTTTPARRKRQQRNEAIYNSYQSLCKEINKKVDILTRLSVEYKLSTVTIRDIIKGYETSLLSLRDTKIHKDYQVMVEKETVKEHIYEKLSNRYKVGVSRIRAILTSLFNKKP